MQYLKISLTGQAKAAISGLGFSLQSYYPAWYIFCKKFDRLRVEVESELKKIYLYSPVRHDDSNGMVRFANVFTKTVNVVTRLGFQHDLESEGVLRSSTRKLSLQLKEQWLRQLQNHRPLAANLIVFKDWLELTAFIHEGLLAQTTSSFQNRMPTQRRTSHYLEL